MRRPATWMLGLTLLVGSPWTQAGDKKSMPPAREIFKVEGKLTADDQAGPAFKESKHHAHTVKLPAGKLLRFDAVSQDFDTFLRLQDDKGKTLAEDDDGGDGLNSRIIFKVAKPGIYKLVVTSVNKKLGVYTLSVIEANQDDVLFARAGHLGEMNKEQRRNFLTELEKHLKDKGPDLVLQDEKLALKTCRTLEGVDMQQAGKAYVELSRILAGSSHKNVVGTSEVMMGISRRLTGKDLDIQGTRMNGKPLDWKSYRGKIVLIDFWATWCAPCRHEFPNMKRLLETYGERGFAIIGVSIDDKHEALEEFLKKEKLPWPCVHEKDAPKGQPLAHYFPLAVLVGRDGRVIAMNAHGPDLEKLLQKHLGAPKK
jgi:thiol-disulfide isomerase/thioredoxin